MKYKTALGLGITVGTWLIIHKFWKVELTVGINVRPRHKKQVTKPKEPETLEDAKASEALSELVKAEDKLILEQLRTMHMSVPANATLNKLKLVPSSAAPIPPKAPANGAVLSSPW